MSIIRYETEAGMDFLATRGSNGEILWRSLESGEESNWSGSPCHATIGEFLNDPMDVANRINDHLDGSSDSPDPVVSAEEVLSEIRITVSDEGLGDVPFDHYMDTIREVIGEAYAPWVDIVVKPVYRTSGMTTKIEFTGLDDERAEREERENVRRLLEKAWERACETCEVPDAEGVAEA